MASSDSRVRRRSRGGERRSGEARHHGGEHQRTAVEAGATGRHTGPFGVNWSWRVSAVQPSPVHIKGYSTGNMGSGVRLTHFM